jgi:hypothetical protein
MGDDRVGGGKLRGPLGRGKRKPWLLSNGSPEGAEKRPFHIKRGKNAC